MEAIPEAVTRAAVTRAAVTRAAATSAVASEAATSAVASEAATSAVASEVATSAVDKLAVIYGVTAVARCQMDTSQSEGAPPVTSAVTGTPAVFGINTLVGAILSDARTSEPRA